MALPRNIEVVLPTFHPGQERAFKFYLANRFVAMRCGRRWGKTQFGVALSVDRALKGYPVGWFAPEYKFLIEPYAEVTSILGAAITSSSEGKGQVNTVNGGKIDFWSLDNPLAGRGREYKLALIDEAAFAKNQANEQWHRNIRPTLVVPKGSAIVMSNTNGIDSQQFFWQICNEPKHQFIDFHAPSSENPYVPPEELELVRVTNDPLVYRQEYLAEFVDWSGVAFFSLDKMLQDGLPVGPPVRCGAVFAIVDSATKTGRENDGTAVTYFAYDDIVVPGKWPLTILDWDIQQIEGALLETWLPRVFERCEELARQCGARSGSAGALIEDKASGMVLLQQAARKGWPARAIDSKLTSLGKSERAINASGPVFMGRVKMSQHAFDKIVVYKGVSRNHLIAQITGFRLGEAAEVVRKGEDDLLDCFCYGVALSLGANSMEYGGF